MLPHGVQRQLLAPLHSLRESGQVSAVRLSTRPDALTPADIRLLAEFQVSLVELGVQSMDDTVLAKAQRGHSAADTEHAFAALHAAGIATGAQLMPGLPGSSADEALTSLERVLQLKPACLRIYPAVVIEGTKLADLYLRGEYSPLTLPDAVSLGAHLLHTSQRTGVPVVRMGLQSTDFLSGPHGVIAGPYHPAFRQLVESKLTYDLLDYLTAGASGSLTVAVHPSRLSDAVGHKGENRHKFDMQGKRLQFVPDASLTHHDLAVTIAGATIKGNIMTDLHYPHPEAHHG